jgi:chromosome segregation ATPase
MFPLSTPPSVVTKSKGVTIEKLQAQLNDRDRQIDELERKLYGEKAEQILDADAEIIRLRKKLENAERLVSEYKEQLHNQTLKTSVNNSKSHISELELEKMRIRLQKRIEELEPLPELLRQAEMKNQELQTRIIDQEKRLAEQAAFITELNSKVISKNFETKDFKIFSLD